MEKAGTGSISDTLAGRETQHGNFMLHAEIEVSLRNILERNSGISTSVQKIALGMIFHKAARILNNGNQHSDTWHDIAGYATLAERAILDE